MLVKLLPDQISKFWDVIKYAIEQSLPPIIGESSNKMDNILVGCLDGSLDVWASYSSGADSNKFEAIVVTEILYNHSSRTKNLLIYCLYGYDKIEEKSWSSGLAALVKYAKSKGCNQIVAYTDVLQLIEVVKQLGGEAKYTFISFNVNELLDNLEE